MKKRILSLLLIMTMGVSLFVGCGDSGAGNNSGTESNSDTSNNVENDQQKDKVKAITVSYNATGKISDTVTCEITYDANLLDVEEYEPVTDLVGIGPRFKHTESKRWFNVTFSSENPDFSAGLYYQKEKTSNLGGQDRKFSELKNVTIGSMEAATYTVKYNESYITQEWLFQFHEGILIMSAEGSEDELNKVEALLKEALLKVTVGGNEPNPAGYAYMLRDPEISEPLYVVEFNPEVFVVEDVYVLDGQDICLNYKDTSHAYQQMEIQVNRYASGLEYFEDYLGKVRYEVGADGQVVKTAGKVGDENIYVGFAKDRRGEQSRLFFIEMPDGNVITGQIPNANESDEVDITSAFLDIYPVK